VIPSPVADARPRPRAAARRGPWPAGLGRARRAGWGRIAAVLATQLLACAACLPGGASPVSPVSPAAPAPPVVGPAAAADGNAGDRAAVAGAYRRFWAVASTVDSQPRPVWRARLAAVAAEPLLSRMLSGFDAQTAAGSRQYGTVVTHPVVVRSDAARASIVDCQDASGSGLLDTATGLPSTVGSARTPVAATLLRGPTGGWRVSEARYLDGSC